MYKGLRVAVVVPAYNEADNLPQTLATIPDYVDHILVVDDGSADKTSTVAAACRRTDFWPSDRGKSDRCGLQSSVTERRSNRPDNRPC